MCLVNSNKAMDSSNVLIFNISELVVFGLPVGTMCYIPFVKLSEEIQNRRMISDFKLLVNEGLKLEAKGKKLIFRRDMKELEMLLSFYLRISKMQ
ncbi:MAG: hypothetical protein WBH44_05745 [Proteocatella sp.]